MERTYEAIFILSSKLSENDLKDRAEELKKLIESNSGVKIIESLVEAKQFAYPIKKETKGTYLTYKFQAPTETISNIKDAIKHREEILRSTFINKEK
jgi:small subunit ribosomal protein S6